MKIFLLVLFPILFFSCIEEDELSGEQFELEGIRFIENKIISQLGIGEEIQLEVGENNNGTCQELNPANFIWSSSNTEVATVTATGKVKALKSGNTFISIAKNSSIQDILELKVANTSVLLLSKNGTFSSANG